MKRTAWGFVAQTGSLRYVGGLLLVSMILVHRAGSEGKSRTSSVRFVQGQGISILPDVVIVKLRVGQSPSVFTPSVQKAMSAAGVVATQRLFPHHRPPAESTSPDLSRIYRFELRSGMDVWEACRNLAQNPGVEYAEPWFVHQVVFTPNDPSFGFQWHLAKVRADSAWDIQRNDTTVIIGIIDTGVSWAHPDLEANLWINRDEVPNNGIDDDNNGYVDDVRGWDFAGSDGRSPDNDPAFRGTDFAYGYHGTQVAGVASAVTNNGLGVAGAAFNAKIMAIKTSADADPKLIVFGYQGVVYAADNGAQIINLSWGSAGSSRFEGEVIAYARSKGVLVVAAAGNENSEELFFPAAYPGVLSVAATSSSDRKANFSNFGHWVDVSAPGVSILSTTSLESYGSSSGTSFSSPLAAGVAALVKARHPDWTGDQVGEQVRISANNIDALNPGYEQKLGYGRINAYRALTVSSPSIRLTAFAINDRVGGNGDGIIDPGEEIRVTGTFTNYLASAANVNITFTTADPFITVTQGSAFFPSLASLESGDTGGNPFRFRVAANAPSGHLVEFRLHLTANGGAYSDNAYLAVEVQPLFADMEVGNVQLTVTSTGRLGFIDYPNNLRGSGFVFGHDGANLLFEGALLVATDPNHVSNVARGADQTRQDNDFVTTVNGQLRIQRPGPVADEQGRAYFTDEGAPNPLGVVIKQESFAFAHAPNNNYVLLGYEIENLTAATLRGLWVGLFADWDIADPMSNFAGFDAARDLGYVYSRQWPTYVGLQVVSGAGASSYAVIPNPDPIRGIYDGFTLSEKYVALSGGFVFTRGDTASDWSHVIAAGPFDLAPGDSLVVGFAVLGGVGLSGLQASADAARAQWHALFEPTGLKGPEKPRLPTRFALEQNYPNPFNAETVIRYQLPVVSGQSSERPVALTIYNSLGQKVRTLVDERQEPGLYQIPWDGKKDDGAEAPTGVYLYELQAGEFHQVRKLLLLR